MSTFSIIFPLLFMASLGYLLTAKGPFTKAHIAGISLFTFYICIPAFLFINMYQADLSRSFELATLGAFYLPVAAVYGLSAALYFALSPKVGERRCESAVFALGCSYSNTILVGLPIIAGALGEQMMGKVFAIITFHSALLFSLTFLLSAKHGKGVTGAWQFSKGIVLNPIVLSISGGLILNLLHISLEGNLINGLRLLSEPALACALFVLGANLAFYKVARDWHRAFLASIIKLLLLPLFVYCVAKFGFKLQQESIALLVLLSASPLGVNAYLVAMQVKAQQSVIASTVVISTVLSVFTMSLWLTLLL